MVIPIRIPDPFEEMVDQLEADWVMARRFGRKFTGKMPPLSHEEYELVRQRVTDSYYNPFHVCGADLEASKRLARDMFAVIEAAREEHRSLRGKLPKMAEIRKYLRERDGDDCWVCGNELGDDPTIEHKVALANGGTWAFDNLVLAHRECNHSLQRLPLKAKEAVRRAINERLSQ